jgi:hypothetical protein
MDGTLHAQRVLEQRRSALEEELTEACRALHAAQELERAVKQRRAQEAVRVDDLRWKVSAYECVLRDLGAAGSAPVQPSAEAVREPEGGSAAPAAPARVDRTIAELQARAQACRRKRVAMKLSQAALGALLGCSQPTVSCIERGVVTVGPWERALDQWLAVQPTPALDGPQVDPAPPPLGRAQPPAPPGRRRRAAAEDGTCPACRDREGPCPDCALRAQRQRWRKKHLARRQEEEVLCPRCDKPVVPGPNVFMKDGKPRAHRDCYG